MTVLHESRHSFLLGGAALFTCNCTIIQSASAPRAPVTDPTPTSGSDPTSTSGRVWLHVESPTLVKVYSRADQSVETANGELSTINTATYICTSPCDAEIDATPGTRFTVRGPYAVESPAPPSNTVGRGVEITGLVLVSSSVGAFIAGVALAYTSESTVTVHASSTAAAKPRYWLGEF